LFDGADVHEHIIASARGLDEPEAFLRIEPLHCSLLGHEMFSKLWVAWQLVGDKYPTVNRCFLDGPT
jgi:hypothetical protein